MFILLLCTVIVKNVYHTLICKYEAINALRILLMFSVVFISILLRLSPGLCQKIGNGYGIKCRIGTSERK